MKIFNEEKKKMIKEQSYYKYGDMIRTMIEKKYYQDHENMVSTMYALSLALEATRETLASRGYDEKMLALAIKTAKEEISLLRSMDLEKPMPEPEKPEKREK